MKNKEEKNLSYIVSKNDLRLAIEWGINFGRFFKRKEDIKNELRFLIDLEKKLEIRDRIFDEGAVSHESFLVGQRIKGLKKKLKETEKDIDRLKHEK